MVSGTDTYYIPDYGVDCGDPACCGDSMCWDEYAALDPALGFGTGEGAYLGLCCSDTRDNDNDCGELNGVPGNQDSNNDGTYCREGDYGIDAWDSDCCAYRDDIFASEEGANNGVCCMNDLDDGLEIDFADIDGAPGPDGIPGTTDDLPPDPTCIIYSGRFIEENAAGSNYVFEVKFKDESSQAGGDVMWTFSFVRAHNCGATVDVSQINGITMPIHAGTEMMIGDMSASADPGQHCVIELSAAAGDYTTRGFYSLNNVDNICPSCTITELPAILTPLSTYSSLPTDAGRAYSKAESIYNEANRRCQSSCEPYEQAAVYEMEANLNAAKNYLDSCFNPGDAACRLSNHYSSRVISLNPF
jgi:hypothetical protein